MPEEKNNQHICCQERGHHLPAVSSFKRNSLQSESKSSNGMMYYIAIRLAGIRGMRFRPQNSVRIRIAGSYDADMVISKFKVRAGNLILGHMAGRAVGFADRADSSHAIA